jgi:hypothetical protein
MPRLVHRPPKSSQLKASGRAVVAIAGEDVYLGAYGSRDSRERYDRAVAEWLASGRSPRPRRAQRSDDPFTVARLVLQFWRHARSWYRTADGRTGEEAFHYRDALRPVVKLYGRTPAGDFGGAQTTPSVSCRITRLFEFRQDRPSWHRRARTGADPFGCPA